MLEDLGRIIPGNFLTSTDYKRWLVERHIDEPWSRCVSHVRSNRNYITMGFDHDASDAEGALAVLINAIFEREREKLPTFLLELLSLYASVKTVYIDVTDVKKDLLAAGYEKEAVSVLDSITVSEQIEVKIQEEQSQEQIVRLLEEAYLAIKEENSQAAIDAYLKWHSAALLYLSSYYTEANPDYHEFKHLDNSGNGHTLRTNYKTWKT